MIAEGPGEPEGVLQGRKSATLAFFRPSKGDIFLAASLFSLAHKGSSTGLPWRLEAEA